MLMGKEDAEALHKDNLKYMWEHNPHLRGDERFQKICKKDEVQHG